MKHLKTIIATIALTILVAGFNQANAQSKVCHVPSQELVESLPAYKSAEKQLKALASMYEAELTSMDNELKAKYQKAQQEAKTQTDEENQRRLGEIQAGEQKMNDYYTNSQQEMGKKRQDLLKPILEKVRAAIQKVAREKGYDYVLDSTTGTGVILADGFDLTADVKKELGI